MTYRVVWQVQPARFGDVFASADRGLFELARIIDDLFADLQPHTRAEPVFSGSLSGLRAATRAIGSSLAEEPSMDLAGYRHLFFPDVESAQIARDRLQRESYLVRAAQVQPQLTEAFWRRHIVHETDSVDRPLTYTASDDLVPAQGYLDEAPDGIGAAHAWRFADGGRGYGIRIVDVERGWNLKHVDLAPYPGDPFYGVNRGGDHGTGVLGIVNARSNQPKNTGIQGIAFEAVARVAAVEMADEEDPRTPGRKLKKWNAADAIYLAARRFSAGDVLLLEMHGPGPRTTVSYAEQGYVPIEYWIAERTAIRFATAARRYVIEAGGNGYENLDDQGLFGDVFSRKNDSGAILVGAGIPPTEVSEKPRRRFPWSNCGSRFDLQAWGGDIATTGGARSKDLVDDPRPERCYTRTFRGTSGAAPIVAGAVACIAGIFKAKWGSALSCFDMRDLVARTGTPQADGETRKAQDEWIGPQPNLKAAIEELLS